ncbi:hypothetical protein [Streptomyces canus]|uniref:hypothetical protein n=1 Tax=Streptomyces canus TaxID=58343 RepID=UPI00074A5AFD|nr:hypothetical protein [Streptomyces canus]KUN11059.1 hypothetical protein AQI96_23240 [Streptomyces canus]
MAPPPTGDGAGTVHGVTDPDPDDRAQSLVRRKLPSNGKYETGTQLFEGPGRLDTTSFSVDIGRTAARRVVASPRIGYIRSGSTRR